MTKILPIKIDHSKMWLWR